MRNFSKLSIYDNLVLIFYDNLVLIFFIIFLFFYVLIKSLIYGVEANTNFALQTIDNLGDSVIASFIFYFFIVYKPSCRLISRIKKITKWAYREFKTDVISSFLQIANISIDNIDELLKVPNFRDLFKNNDTWYAITNAFNNNPKLLKEWRVNAIALKDDLTYLMVKIEPKNIEAEKNLRVLQKTLIRFLDIDTEYDEIKSLLRLFWTIFAGGDFNGNNRDYDIVEQCINDL
jgi:hypothetical protein